MPASAPEPPNHDIQTSSADSTVDSKQKTFRFDRGLHSNVPVIVSGKGNYLFTEDGRTIFDAATGAAVSGLGHGNERVRNAINNQLTTGVTYLASAFWGSSVAEDLCEELINGTGREMSRVYLTGSGMSSRGLFHSRNLHYSLGSEAMEAALKLARQFFYESDKQTPRVNLIAREGSYHGNTLGALSVSGHVARRAPYLPFLMPNVHHIPACNAYRQRKEGESDPTFVARKVAELEAKFQELGPETVIAFVAEPIVGAALGCVPYVPGYLKAMRDVCHRHGALLIFDEVMCGLGRSGTLHAWQAEGIAPDIEIIGKGVAAGYLPIAAVLISEKVVKVLSDGSGQFIHGQTFQGMPIQAAAALEVQRIIREDNILENINTQGTYLGEQLKLLLSDHPNVGDIRGRGLFWGIEFVRNKDTKEPFDPKLGIAQRILDCSISAPYNMTVYPGSGTAGGVSGDHIILAPTYLVTKDDIDHIVKVTSDVVRDVFQAVGRL